MRILHVITSLHTGGAEKLMGDLLPRFKEAGHDVEIAVFNGDDTPFLQQLLNDGIKVHRLSTGGSVYSPSHILKLHRLLPHYDIIHAHNTACQYYVAAASIFTRHHARLVTTEHNTTNRRRSKAIFKLIDRMVYRAYDQLVAIAQSTADNLRKHIHTHRPIKVIENGINISQYDAPIRDISPNNDIVVTMVAAFRPQKNQDTLVKAMSSLPERYKLWLVGTGQRREDVERLVRERDLDHRVSFLGNRTDIPEIMRDSDVIVLSSHWEGLSLSSVEGLASGRPVIASDVPGLQEVIQGAGLLAKANDARDLAQKIEQVTTDPELYRSVAKACKSRAAHYDISVTAAEHLAMYEQLVNQ